METAPAGGTVLQCPNGMPMLGLGLQQQSRGVDPTLSQVIRLNDGIKVFPAENCTVRQCYTLQLLVSFIIVRHGV